MILVEDKSLKKRVLEKLKMHYNYPMLENIDFYQKEDAIGYTYYVSVKLKDQFEFDNDNYDYSNSTIIRLNNLTDEDSITRCIEDRLISAQLKDLYLHHKVDINNTSDYETKMAKFSIDVFCKITNELDKNELKIALTAATLEKYNSSLEIVEDLKIFWQNNGRFPYKTEWLYKTLEYARKCDFLKEEDIININNIASNNSFNKICSFIENNKRWPYETEKEYVRTWNEVCYNFKNGNLDDKQIVKLDILWSKYNNGSDTLGERIVNSYLSGLGYSIEKQKTFEDLKYINKLRFDTCITIGDKIALIEYDGPQHFIPIDYFGGEEKLKETQIRDLIKDDYCKLNDIPLLRIRYDQIKDVENIINTFITDLSIKEKKLG